MYWFIILKCRLTKMRFVAPWTKYNLWFPSITSFKCSKYIILKSCSRNQFYIYFMRQNKNSLSKYEWRDEWMLIVIIYWAYTFLFQYKFYRYAWFYFKIWDRTQRTSTKIFISLYLTRNIILNFRGKRVSRYIFNAE